MRSLHLLTVVIISLAAAASAAAQSQITTAVIDGTVVDASGAVLPGVEVEIRNADTNLTRTLTTDREAQLRHTLDSFERSAASMERLTMQLDSVRASLQNVSGKVDRGEGTLGKLVNDDKLYNDARQSVTSLHQLIEDIKKNPKKYLNLKVF